MKAALILIGLLAATARAEDGDAGSLRAACLRACRDLQPQAAASCQEACKSWQPIARRESTPTRTKE
jgi:hypothetical protein